MHSHEVGQASGFHLGFGRVHRGGRDIDATSQLRHKDEFLCGEIAERGRLGRFHHGPSVELDAARRLLDTPFELLLRIEHGARIVVGRHVVWLLLHDASVECGLLQIGSGIYYADFTTVSPDLASCRLLTRMP